MERSIKTPGLWVVFAVIALFSSCVFGDMKAMFDQANQITSVLQNNCDCEKVSIVKYSAENTTITAQYKLEDCNLESIDNEALRVRDLLTDSIPNFCEIDYFDLIFVDQGTQTVKSFAKCQEE
jgi:hypothetical protein